MPVPWPINLRTASAKKSRAPSLPLSSKGCPLAGVTGSSRAPWGTGKAGLFALSSWGPHGECAGAPLLTERPSLHHMPLPGPTRTLQWWSVEWPDGGAHSGHDLSAFFSFSTQEIVFLSSGKKQHTLPCRPGLPNLKCWLQELLLG